MTVEDTLSVPMRKEHPFRAYKRQQEVISRHKIYKTTAIYTTYWLGILVWAGMSGYFLRALAFMPLGIFLWMLAEYSSHRWVFHHKFVVKDDTPTNKFFTTLGAKYLDPLHTGHHEKPYDGNHMSGRVRDVLPLFALFVPLSFLFPAFTATVVVATFFQGYIMEEWIHHATHFYNFKDPYFRYMKKHHLFHHTAKGQTHGFGTTSGVLDAVFDSRYPFDIRRKLYGAKKPYTPVEAVEEQA